MAKHEQKHRCPIHQVKLDPRQTRYGVRWSCPVEGCTVVCWNGDTSTPADDQTRQARHAAHAIFDPLWQRAGLSKGEAYKQLADYMGLTQKQAHIGRFTKEQCEQVLAFCRQSEVTHDNGRTT